MTTVDTLWICPSRKSLIPNQKARAKLEYMARKIGASCSPRWIDIFIPFPLEIATLSKYFLFNDSSAPREKAVRIELKTSPAIEAAVASAFSICWTSLMITGVVML